MTDHSPSSSSHPDLAGLDDVERMLKVVTLLQNELEEKNRELASVNDKLARANMELERMALTDPLTLLFNRRYFMDQAEKEISRHNRVGAPLSLLLLDIDHFKSINDTFGHPQGDSVIISTANLLQELVRQHDIVARFGGEEFIVLLPETDSAGALAVAEKIRSDMEKHSIPGMGERRVTVSIGVGTLEVAESISLMQFIERVDRALYEAKRSGRNRVGR